MDTQPDDPFMPSLRALLPSYGLATSAALTRLAISENRTYRAFDGTSDLVLRVHRTGYHSRAEILCELAWLDALDALEGVTIVQPVRRLDGERLSAVRVAGQAHAVSAFAFLAGEEPRIDEDLTGRFEALGAITARLHGHARGWERPSGFVRKRWDFAAMFGSDPLWGDWRVAFDQADDRGVIETLLQAIAARVEAYGTGPERFGLIHGDLRLANLLDDGARLAVIDFDDCGFGWFAYDFAAAISFHEEDDTIPALQAAWLTGYRRVAPFGAADEAMLPTMIMMRRLVLTAWLASRAGNDTAADHGAGYAAGTLGLARLYLADAP